jgi:plastocyanin
MVLASGLSGFALLACGGGGQAGAPAMKDMPATPAPAAAAVASPVATSSVDIANFSFNPAVITVKGGVTVTWTNKDQDAHTVAITGTAVSKVLQNGDTYTHTFDVPGTYSYTCTIHPTMHGMVVVTTG